MVSKQSQIPQKNVTPKQPSGRRAVIALCLAVLGTIIPLVIQYVATVEYNKQGPGGNAAWGIAVFFYAILSVGFVGWPLSIASLILGIASLKKDRVVGLLKAIAITAIVVVGFNLFVLVIVAMFVSGMVGQP